MESTIVGDVVSMRSGPLLHPIDESGLLQQSLLFAELAKISYFRPDIVAQAITDIGFEHHEYFDRDGAQAYVFGCSHP